MKIRLTPDQLESELKAEHDLTNRLQVEMMLKEIGLTSLHQLKPTKHRPSLVR